MSNNDKLNEGIRKILLENWDPVGIGENPNLRDEYDDYILDIVNICSSVISVKKNLFDYLCKIEANEMATKVNYNRNEFVSKILIKLVLDQ
jgi:hypothetical protein